jgi:hypothetical protein
MVMAAPIRAARCEVSCDVSRSARLIQQQLLQLPPPRLAPRLVRSNPLHLRHRQPFLSGQQPWGVGGVGGGARWAEAGRPSWAVLTVVVRSASSLMV